MKVETFPVSIVWCGDRLRPVSAAAVDTLAQSMSRLGLHTPITVLFEEEFTDPETGEVTAGVPVLIAGAHRLAAARKLGWEDIDAFVIDGDRDDARLWEISENLHRADLSVQERADQIAEWVRITESKSDAAQVAPHRKAGQQPGGINSAVRELGIDRTEAQRAVKIASITPEAREAADDAGLNTQKARLEIAKADDQVAKVAELRQKASDHKLMESAADNVVVKQALTDAAQRINDTMPEHEVDALMADLDAAKLHKLTGAIRRARTGVRGGSDRPVFDRGSSGRFA